MIPWGTGALAIVLLGLLQACATEPSYRQSAVMPSVDEATAGKAVVIIAIDMRAETSMRDGADFGAVYFRKVDASYASRPKDQYDFAVVNSAAADWAALFGKIDTNRLPYLFEIEPGTYVIERLEVLASSPRAPGYRPDSGRVSYGVFSVQPGEVVNLGKLIVRMQWRFARFRTEVEPNEAEARKALAVRHPGLATRLQTRPIEATAVFPF